MGVGGVDRLLALLRGFVCGMAVKISTVIDYPIPANVEGKRFSRIMTKVLKEVGGLWKKSYLPKHFNPEAFSRYAGVYRYLYGANTKVTRPLVDTGQLRIEAKSAKVRKWRPGGDAVSGVKVVIRTAHQFPRARKPDPQHPERYASQKKWTWKNIGLALTVMNDQEQEYVKKYIMRRIPEELTKLRRPKRVRAG